MSTVTNPLLAILEAEAAKSQPAPQQPAPAAAPPVTFNPAPQAAAPAFNPFQVAAAVNPATPSPFAQPIQTPVGAVVNPAPVAPQAQVGVPGVFAAAVPNNVIEMPVVQHGPMAGFTAPVNVPENARLGQTPPRDITFDTDGSTLPYVPTDAEIGRVVRFLLGR